MRKSYYIILAMLFVVTLACGSGNGETSERATNTPKPTATPLPILVDDFFTIRDNANNMTDAQWDVYVKTIENTQTTWTGYIVDVKSDGKISIDMDSPDDLFSTSDCYFKVPQDTVLNYEKGQVITWTGTVKSVTRFMGMVINFDSVVVHP